MHKLKFLEFLSQQVFPAFRPFISSKISKRCRQCINSEIYQSLIDGICNDCIEYNKTTSNDEYLNEKEVEHQLENILNEFSGKSHFSYDACVLFSGGKDSSLLVYKLKKEFPRLKLLLLTIDNGLMSDIALDNVEQIVGSLKIDHYILKTGNEIFERSFKYAFENLNGKGCSQVVDMIDGDLIHDVALHFASKMNIPLLISGLSKEQVQNIINIKDFKLPDSRLNKKREYSGILKLVDFSTDSDYEDYWWDPQKYNNIPTVLYPNYIWDYSNEEIIDLMENKCGVASDNSSPLVTNHKLVPVMAVLDFNNLGYSSFEPEFSNRVRREKENRQYWLNIFQLVEFLSKYTSFFDKEVCEIFKRLKVDKKRAFNE